MKRFTSALILSCLCFTIQAQTITVKDTVMTTYPFGEPDPVAKTGKIYPYWRFQRFSTESTEQSWKMIVLENQYLRVKIFPEIGGKVWSIFDKKAGKELVYDNDVVKFREIALRGPWTSGGIEFNYGVIGHAPSCSAPVDWKTASKSDGSVSCYIGVLEMLSRTRWVVEINLPPDAVWCRTRSIWYNLSGEWQPYYSWANSAVETSDDLMLVYPSRNAVGHQGELMTYPVNENGVDISLLSNQNYGKDKSYHMVGSHKSYFGAYYPSSDWGLMHWSLRDEKLGRKYFTWAQSAQGNIWINLLTDSRPQYVELQSGRLYNQNEFGSCANTPYRQILFTPYGTDEWSDYWLPYGGIGEAGNVTLDAVVSVRGNGRNKSEVGVYPLRPYSGKITILASKGDTLVHADATFSPGAVKKFKVKGIPFSVKLGGRTIWTEGNGITDRPQKRDSAYAPSKEERFTLLCRDCIGLKMYDKAENYADSALSCNRFSLEALCLKAAILYRRMDYEGAYRCSDTALSIDQYCPEAGYYGGLAAVALGKDTDAMDRFEVAAISGGEFRQASYTELARIHFRLGDRELAKDYAVKALNGNGRNVTALMILAAAGEDSYLDQIRTIDPLNHFPAAQEFISSEISASELASDFKGELPWEDYIEIALFYHSLGLDAEGAELLDSVPEGNVLTALWSAYLKMDSRATEAALEKGMDFAFPFRKESAKMLEWASGQSGSWKCDYLLALLKANFGYSAEAAGLLSRNDSDYAPYYAFRYSCSGDISDLRLAFKLDSSSTYRLLLATNLIQSGAYGEAAGLLEGFYAENPGNFRAGDALIDAYIGLGRFGDAEKIIDNITYLPFEGQQESHNKYRHIKLHLAAAACDEGRYARALSLVDEALLWPERLGVGKPYEELVDDSAEKWVREQIILRRDGKCSEALSPLLQDLRTKDKKMF